MHRHLRTLLALCIAAVAFAAVLWAQDNQGTVAEPRPPLLTEARAKNIIILIADGAGYNHMEAGSFYQCGEAICPPLAEFPIQFAMSTHSVKGSYDPAQAWTGLGYLKQGATDSAAAATAMACGVKTYDAAIGVDESGNPVESNLEKAERAGKSTGVVTSVTLSHATPAAFVAHVASRSAYETIAQQMIGQSAVDVIMGAGNPAFDNNGQPRAQPDYRYVGGQEQWEALLAGTCGADADGDGQPDPWTLIQTRAEFQALASGEAPRRVLGVPQVLDTLQEARDTDPASKDDEQAPAFVIPFTQTIPTLAEMTRAALNVLDGDPDGLFLMVEGGAVDWAAHDGLSGRMIEEMLDFYEAVAAVVEWVERNSSWDETLVIVTSDHETGCLTGPEPGDRMTAVTSQGQGQMPGLAWNSTGHTNSLVPLFARGAGASLFELCADRSDPTRGRYVDNTDIGRVCAAVLPAVPGM